MAGITAAQAQHERHRGRAMSRDQLSSEEAQVADHGFAAVGALQTWRARLRRDPRSLSTYDSLFHAACLEAHGFEALRAGLTAVAEAHFQRAAERLLAATKRQAA